MKYNLRPGQEKLKREVITAYQEGYRYINMDTCVRVGKSILSLDIAKTLGMHAVYIGKNLTSQSSVLKEQDTFNIVQSMSVCSLHGNNEESKFNRIVENIDNTNIFELPVVFFVDEVDDQSHTERSISTLKKVIKHYKDVNAFGALITMTGTRAHRGMKVLNRVKDASDKTKETSIAYYELQKLQPEVTVKRNFFGVTVFAQSTELSNISQSMKSNPGRETLAETITNVISHENKFGISFNESFPHVFVKVCSIGKDNANKLVDAMNKKHTIINNKLHFFANINGSFTRSSSAEEYCEKIISENPDARVVFISQGMATTSFSVKSIGTTLVMSDNEMSADDIQALHRSCTFAEGKEDANLVYLTTNDSNELRLDEIFESEIKPVDTSNGQSERDGLAKGYADVLESNSLTYCLVNDEGVKAKKVLDNGYDLFDMIDKKSRQQSTIQSIVNMMMDVELSDALLNSISPTSVTSKKSKTQVKEEDGTEPMLTGSENPGETPEEKTQEDVIKEMSKSKREKYVRSLVQQLSLIAGLCGTKQLEINQKNLKSVDWSLFEISKLAFETIYEENTVLADRLNTVNNLCNDVQYFVDNYGTLLTKLAPAKIKNRKPHAIIGREVQMNTLHIYNNYHIFDNFKKINQNDVIITVNSVTKELYRIYELLNDVSLPEGVKFVSLQELLDGEIDNMKFKNVVGNPPYQGTAQLHQRVFNKSVEMLEDGGQLTFIQPAYPFYNNKNTSFEHNNKMIEMVKFYQTSVKFVPGTVFKDAGIFGDLAITTLTKIPGNETIDRVEYVNGNVYENVHVEDICMNMVPPHLFRSIRKKYEKLIESNGSLNDIGTHEDVDNKVFISSIRGHTGCNDFWTFFSSVDPVKTIKANSGKLGLIIKNNEKPENVYDYLETNFARYGLSMLKTGQNCFNGGLTKLVPLMPFTKKYSDEELFDLIGLTQEERDVINKTIPTWNHYG